MAPRRPTQRRRLPLGALVVTGWLALRCGSALAQQAAVPETKAAAPQAAATPCPSCGDEQHDGIYVRLSVGLASMRLGNDNGGGSGLAATASFALGYFILPNFALSIDGFTAETYKVGVPTGSDGTTTQFDTRALAAGLSLTYYFPLDFYVSLAPGVGWLLPSNQAGDTHVNGAGFALDALAGKEWWIGGAWALGAGAQLIYIRSDNTVSSVGYAWSLGVLFTVTSS
jgi:hypothetical protein